MKVKRGNEFSPIEATMLKLMWQEVKQTPKDGRWRNFTSTMEYLGEVFDVKCSFRFEGEYLSLAEKSIERQRKTLIIPPIYH